MMRPGSAPICTISHELDCCSSTPIHGVAAAIEDEVLAGGGLLKASDVAETAGDVRGHRARLSGDFGLDGAQAGDEETDSAERAENRGEASWLCDLGELRGQYLAVSRMAFRMSADCGRIASSRSGE